MMYVLFSSNLDPAVMAWPAEYGDEKGLGVTDLDLHAIYKKDGLQFDEKWQVQLNR